MKFAVILVCVDIRVSGLLSGQPLKGQRAGVSLAACDQETSRSLLRSSAWCLPIGAKHAVFSFPW